MKRQPCCTVPSETHYSPHQCTVLFFVHLIGKTQSILCARNMCCHWSCLTTGAKNWQLDQTCACARDMLPCQAYCLHIVIRSLPHLLCRATVQFICLHPVWDIVQSTSQSFVCRGPTNCFNRDPPQTNH